jgi:hypothetical protein
MIVTRDALSGRLVPVMQARDSKGQTFAEALASIPEKRKRQIRVGIFLSCGLLDLAAKHMCTPLPTPIN